LRSYKIGFADIAATIQDLINGANVVVNRPAAEAGLAMLIAGGDFADGVIAYEGSWLGADTFVSFDKKAVGLLEAHGKSARLLI
jgi:predicted nucleic-acid-binding protein